MKKGLLILLVVFFSIATLTSCKAINNDEILKKVSEANNKEALLKVTERIAYNLTEYHPDGSSEDYYTYQDKNLYALDANSYIMLATNEGAYEYDKETNTPRILFYIHDTYQKELETTFSHISSFSFDESEKVTTSKAENGILYFEAIMPFSENMVFFEGYEINDKAKIKTLYEVDEKTYIIEKMSTFYIDANGKEQPCLVSVREQNPAEYTIIEELINAMNPKETRTVTLIETDANGNEIERFEKIVGKGYGCLPMLPEEYDPYLYLDAKCTEQMTESADPTKDLTRYIHKYTK